MEAVPLLVGPAKTDIKMGKLLSCPRCNGEWQDAHTTEETFKCDKCGIYYYAPWDDNCHMIELTLSKEPNGKRITLEWEINNQICFYYAKHKRTTLPWLSFNIDNEQLHLYLLMS